MHILPQLLTFVNGEFANVQNFNIGDAWELPKQSAAWANDIQDIRWWSSPDEGIQEKVQTAYERENRPSGRFTMSTVSVGYTGTLCWLQDHVRP